MRLLHFEAGIDRPLFLIAGPCVVESDLAVDLDDCFDRRIITVKVMAGHNQGAIIEIPRRLLRKR